MTAPFVAQPDRPAGLHAALSRRSLRTRIALLAATAVGVTVALASLVSFLIVRYEVNRNLDDNLQRRATAVARSRLPQTFIEIARSPATGPTSLVVQQLVALGADVRLTVLSDGAKLVVGPGPDAGAPVGSVEMSVADGARSDSIRSLTSDGVTYRVVAVATPGDPGTAVVLAQSMRDTNRLLGRVALVMVIVGVAGIAVAAASGLTIARAGLRPVDRLTAAAEHIARTGDLRPIPVSGDDELARLTQSFNSMLTALSESRERQHQLVADAGHELRTPLTSLRTNLDLLAQASAPGAARTLDPEEHESLLRDVRAQLHELTGLVSDLVELARTDPSTTASVEMVDISEPLQRALERVRRRAPGLSWATTIEPWLVPGDAAAIERAITNLLDNAAKWSPPGGTVSVTLSSGTLRVADEGPGIAPEDQPHVFERFYRAANARGLPGSGLGLAIVRQVAERHGGWVQSAAAPGGGALMMMWLPGRPAAASPDNAVRSESPR